MREHARWQNIKSIGHAGGSYRWRSGQHSHTAVAPQARPITQLRKIEGPLMTRTLLLHRAVQNGCPICVLFHCPVLYNLIVRGEASLAISLTRHECSPTLSRSITDRVRVLTKFGNPQDLTKSRCLLGTNPSFEYLAG